MQNLNEHIKQNNFKPTYLIYGEESYLIQQYKNRLKTAILNNSDEMNYNYFEGKSIQVNKIIEAAETLPFFNDKRLIIIENSELFKKQNELSEYIQKIPPTTHIIFIEKEIDKRSKLFKEIKKMGTISEMNSQDELSLTKWILGILKKENKSITKESLDQFLSKTGTSMDNIKQELEKLICYTMDKEIIQLEDIETICSIQTSNKIFDMITSIAEKNQKKALSLYYDLLTLKEPAMRILFLISRQFNILYQVKDLKRLGYNNQIIGQKLGYQPFIINKYISQSNNFKEEYLRNAVERCVQTEEEIKTGRCNDVLGVELIIIEFSN